MASNITIEDEDTTAQVTKSYSEELSLSPDGKREEDSAHDVVRCENAKCLTRMEEIEMERDRYMLRCQELEKELAAQKIAMKMEHMSETETIIEKSRQGDKVIEASNGQWVDIGIKHVAYIQTWDDTKTIETKETVRAKGEMITLVHGGVYGKVRYKVKRKAETETRWKDGVRDHKSGAVTQDSCFQSDESDTEDVSGAKAGEAYITRLAADKALSW